MTTLQNAQVTAGPNWLDRAILIVAPRWGLNRLRSRAIAATLSRHYEAAAGGRRTTNWPRSTADANAANGPAIGTLRALARDLVRNNPWAEEALRILEDHTVGTGIIPKPLGDETGGIRDLWKSWAETTQCDADGRLTFYGLQALAMRTVAEAGEVLVRRRRRRAEDGLAIPIQLQVLEPDFIDTTKDGLIGQEGGPIVQGVEFDAIGRRVAYWLFERHPGSNLLGSFASRRVTASDILHVYRVDRPGQARGVSWFKGVIVRLRDFDEYEDATLMRQKIAACFAAFVTDVDGAGAAIGEQSTENPLVETIEPGLVAKLPPGRDISFANPPVVSDHDSYSATTLRSVAAGVGATYEDMTGDYSRVNFSSARMGRLKHWAHIQKWRWNMLIPQFCDGAWAWAMEAAVIAGLVRQPSGVEWTAPPMPMLEPDREGLALTRLVRAGARTPSEVVREQGYEPEAFFDEYAKDLKKLDELGIMLDSDVRKVSQAGLTQERAGGKGKSASGGDAGK